MIKTPTVPGSTTGLNETKTQRGSMTTTAGTLSQLRESLGKLHPSDTFGKIHESKAVEIDARGLFAYASIANRVVENLFIEAAFMFTHTDNRMYNGKPEMLNASSMAFAFITGTGLEIMLESYGLDYNADTLRTVFYDRFNIKEA